MTLLLVLVSWYLLSVAAGVTWWFVRSRESASQKTAGDSIVEESPLGEGGDTAGSPTPPPERRAWYRRLRHSR
jgi:hypothetical protein